MYKINFNFWTIITIFMLFSFSHNKNIFSLITYTIVAIIGLVMVIYPTFVIRFFEKKDVITHQNIIFYRCMGMIYLLIIILNYCGTKLL